MSYWASRPAAEVEGTVYSEKAAPWTHSPNLGCASDNSASATKRVGSGFRLRSITTRTTLPDWSLPNHSGVSRMLTAARYGPAVSAKFPLGRYVEDYRWASGVGEPGFPYLLAGQFHGTVSGGFSALDYFNAGTVTSGPITVTTLAVVASSASYEQGSLDWPMTLGGATVTRVRNGVTSTEEVYTAALGAVTARPIALGTDQVYLTLFGSGLGSAASATATIGGVSATVQYAGPYGIYGGLDQYNILIPASLAGTGKVDVVVTVGGKPSNPVNITVQ